MNKLRELIKKGSSLRNLRKFVQANKFAKNQKLLAKIPGLQYYNVTMNVLKSVSNIPLQTIDISGYFLMKAIYAYLNEHSVDISFKNAIYDASIDYVRPLKKLQLLGYESSNNRIKTVYWLKKKNSNMIIPIIIGGFYFIENGTRQSRPDTEVTFQVLRGSINVKKFLVDVIDHYNKNNDVNINGDSNNRYSIRKIVGTAGITYDKIKTHNTLEETDDPYPTKSDPVESRLDNNAKKQLLSWEKDQIGLPIKCNPLNDLYFPEDTVKLINEIKIWYNSKDWYTETRIPWKRGVLLYGAPGTGKTSLIRALGQDLGIPIWHYDLASLRNEEFVREWNNMLRITPCIALIEDIDAVFHNRENVSGVDGSLTMDDLLNCLDGIEENTGVLLAITTNNIDKVDEAIGIPDKNDPMKSTRPGRIDRCVKLLSLNLENRKFMAQRILNEWPEHHEKIVIDGDGDTGAQFQERCGQLALNLFWEQKNKS